MRSRAVQLVAAVSELSTGLVRCEWPFGLRSSENAIRERKVIWYVGERLRHIRYCARCVMPETKPDLFIDDVGVCSACRAFERRIEVDWKARRDELLVVLERFRSKDGSNYDCIVPVSGGKDSHAQAIRLLELGMNPLCVTATTDHLSAIGRRNIENLKKQGVDYIEVTTNPVVRRKINRLALTQVGDISWPE